MPNPVKPGIRRLLLGAIVLLLMAAAGGAYAFLTSDEFIRRGAIRALTQMTGGEVRVGGASFSLFHGVRLTDLSISTPADAAFFGGAAVPADREFVRAGAIDLNVAPWPLLIGRLNITRIVASAPVVHVIHHAGQRRYNWNLLSPPHRSGAKRSGPPLQPELVIRSAEIHVTRIDAAGRSDAQPYVLDADAWPHPAIDGAYLVDYRVYGDNPHRTRGLFDPRGGELTGSPFVGSDELREVLPAEFVAFCDRLSLRGDFRLKRMSFAPTSVAASQPGAAADHERIRVEFRRLTARLQMPWRSAAASAPATASDARSASSAPADDYTPCELTDGAGWIELAGDELTADFDARLNGQRARVRGVARGVRGDPARIVVDLHLQCRGIRFPDDALHQRLLADMSAPPSLRYFLYDFDARGPVDLDLDVSCNPRRDREWRVRGELRPAGASTAYYTFRYRVHDLRGLVRFTDDGIHLDELAGHHGDATITLRGCVHHTGWWTGFDFQVSGQHVMLDHDMLSALPERHRELWQLFRPSGAANVEVRIHRDEGDAQHGPGPLRIRVAIDFQDAELCLTPFPDPLQQVTGRMEIDERRIVVSGLSGRHDGGTVCVDGSADYGDRSNIQIDLRVHAQHVPLDEVLLSALPERAGRELAALTPRGRFDIDGWLRRGGAAGVWQYDLLAALRDVDAAHPLMKLPLQGLSGEVHLTPTGIELKSVRGHYRDSPVTVDGQLTDAPQGQENSPAEPLRIQLASLPIDDTLCRDLPAELSHVIQSSGLRGTADVVLTRVDVPDSPASARRISPRLEVRLHDARLRHPALPVPLTAIEAEISDDGATTVVSRCTARLALGESGGAASASAAAGPRIELAGRFDRAASPPSGVFDLMAWSLPLDDAALIDALPASAAATWRAARLSGRADLRVPRLEVAIGADGRSIWQATGELRLSNAAWTAGVDCDEADGVLTGRVQVARAALDAVEVQSHWDRVRVMGLPLTDARAKGTLAGGEFRVEEITARAVGGALTGFVSGTLQPPRPRYGLSISLADATVSELLRHLAHATDADGSERGRLMASLSLRGAFGDAASREGSGEIVARDLRGPALPLVPALFASLGKNPGERPFDDARLQYVIMGDQMRVSRVDVQGGVILLGGAGTIDLPSGRMNLRLVATPPTGLRVPVLTELVEGATREFIEVRVTGTWGAPLVRAEPLASVQRFLDEVFGQPVESRRP